jgi:hypothetical protein
MNILFDSITAISTLTTAIIAILVYFVTKRQAAISTPVIEFNTPGNSLDDYRTLSLSINPSDREKFKLEKLVVNSPPSARLANKVSNTETNIPEPGDWRRELVIDNIASSIGVYFKGPRGSRIDIFVYVVHKSDAKVKSRLPITVNMH